MRLSLLSVTIMAGVLSVPVPREAAAVPVTTATPWITLSQVGGSILDVYYYHGRSYRYRYGGHYYGHRYYRYGRWHYY
jgi:hypothetical protein